MVKRKTSARTKREKRGEDMRAVLLEVAGESKRARMMVDVEEFRVVPTELVSFNRATTVGGAPISCVWLVHGPESGGKTALTCALIKAFQQAGGIAAFVDAEHSADTKRWFPQLGVDTSRCIYIGRTDDEAEKVPLTYEETVEECEGLLHRYQVGKKKGTIAPRTPMLIVVDSVSRLVPKDVMTKVGAKGKGKGGDVLRSGIGRLQAMMNRGWLSSLGPKVGDDDIAFVVIAHEFEQEDYTAVSVRGGKSLKYDAMMQLRVLFANKVTDKSADDAPMVGKRHRIMFLKNKHGPAFREAVFYTSNGKGICPPGFDKPREIIHEAVRAGLIDGGDAESGRLKLYAGTRVDWDGATYKLASFYDPGNEAAQGALAAIAAELSKENT